jgi:uncharacterized membrane protein
MDGGRKGWMDFQKASAKGLVPGGTLSAVVASLCSVIVVMGSIGMYIWYRRYAELTTTTTTTTMMMMMMMMMMMIMMMMMMMMIKLMGKWVDALIDKSMLMDL